MKFKLKYCLFVCVSFFFILYFILYKFLPYYTKVDYGAYLQSDFKSIQLLTGRFDWPNWGLGGFGADQFKKCGEKRCYLFKPTDFLQTPSETSDAILVHGPNLWYLPSKLNYQRSQRQIWAYHSLESPRGAFCSMHYTSSDLDDWFNVTITYKLDSTIVIDYKNFFTWTDLTGTPEYIKEFGVFLKNNPSLELFKEKKRGKVIWIVSHCETSSRREDYVREMQNYVDIDIYGNCDSYFTNAKQIPCSFRDSNCGEFLMNLINSYSFYLSFENSLCDDYISEKFWKLYASNAFFNVDIIPVVRGAREDQYKKVAAPHSYINAENFQSPKHLADYLNYLVKNQSEYLNYFKWKIELYNEFKENFNKVSKTQTFFRNDLDKALCDLCSLLHNNEFMSGKHYSSKRWKMSEWFSEKGTCWDKDEPRWFFYKIAQFLGYCF